MAHGLRRLYPGIPPQAALDHLRSCARADSGGFGRQQQIDALELWLRDASLCVPKQALDAIFVGAGAEHSTFFDVADGVAFKVTFDGRFGHCLRDEGAIATPLDYLERLALHNELFADDILLHGLLESSSGMRLVSSQPWIVAPIEQPSPAQEDIDLFLGEFGFVRSGAFPDGFVYFNAEADLVIGDAQPANVLIDEAGVLHPIDLVIARPAARFRERLVAARVWGTE
jgi:hypothetical protein